MKMNKKVLFSMTAVVLTLVLASRVWSSSEGVASAEMKNDLSLEMQVPVSTISIERGQLQDTIFAVGSVQPSATYTVNAKVTGDVDEVFFNIGDTVKKGDILFKMKDETFNSDKTSKSQTLKNQMDVAKIQYDQAGKTYSDIRVLFDSGAVSTDDLNKAELNYKNAKAGYENAKLNYQATLSALGDQTDFYTVKSPVNGLITDRNIEKGMFASSQNGFTIIVDDSLKIDATVASKYISAIKVGQKVDIYVNTLDKHYKGELASVSYAAQKGSYPVEIMFTEKDEMIYTGMFAELDINIASKDNVLLLPIDALVRDNKEQYIYKIVEDKAVKTEVVLGIRSNTVIEVSGDIKEGDLVITEGKEFLSDGSSVEIK